MDSEFKQLIHALWIIIPAYIANASPVVGIKVLGMSGIKTHPVDGGKSFVDGRRVFGDSKTWEGLFIGVAAGGLTGIIQAAIDCSYVYIVRGFALGFGAMLGDLIGSFVKRRLGIEPGRPLPILDQVLFLFVAIALGLLTKSLTITLTQFLFLTAITIVLHISTNYVAYKLRLKKVPW